MSIAGSTKWKICMKCGRKFLAIDKRDNNSSCYLYCPKCRAIMARKMYKDITDKWLNSNK